MEHKKKKNDFLLIFGVLFLAAALWSALLFYRRKNQEPSGVRTAVGTLDGREIFRFRTDLPLSDSENQIDEAYVTLDENGGFTVFSEGADNPDSPLNSFLMEHNGLRCVAADCPDAVCIDTGQIQNGGESIACLPHRLIVTLV